MVVPLKEGVSEQKYKPWSPSVGGGTQTPSSEQSRTPLKPGKNALDETVNPEELKSSDTRPVQTGDDISPFDTG